MIQYANRDYHMTIDENQGAITSLELFGKELLSAVRLPLCVVQFRDSVGNIIKADIRDGILTKADHSENKLMLQYASFSDVDVIVSITAIFSDTVRWRVSVLNNSPYVIEWVDLPQIAVRNELKYMGGDKKLLWGFNEGAIVEDLNVREANPQLCFRDPEYPQEGTMCIYPGIVETQFMAYYGETGGLYLGTHDNKGNVKGIDFEPVEDGIRLRFRLFSGLDYGESFDMDYDFVMQAFIGDWYDAADIYRRWFDENKPAEFVKASVNPKMPEWYYDSPIVITYPVRGVHDMDEMTPNRMYPYINAMKHVEHLAKETESRIMVILMHWEGTAPWAPPYVWPPFGGEEELGTFIKALHDEHHLLGVYCSGIGWTMQSNLIKTYNREKQYSDENLKEAMCLSPMNTLPFSKICTGQRRGYDMCPSQRFTKDVICSEVKAMVGAGIDYIQVLDQNHGGTSYFCYSKKHGHPPVPGRWQVEEMKALFTKLEEITQKSGKKVLLGCESAAAESYVPYLAFSDNRYLLNYRIGSYAVPVYAYVLHEYVTNFMGNQVCAGYAFHHDINPDNLLFRTAYSFAAGDIMTLVLDQDGNVVWNWGLHTDIGLPDQNSILTYVRNANRIRKGIAKKFFVGGRMTKPFGVKTEGENVMELQDGHRYHAPKLLTTAWIAEDGEYGQIITNYNNEPIGMTVETSLRYSTYSSDGSDITGQTTIPPLDTILITYSR